MFSQKKAFLIFFQIKPCTFHPKLEEQKKSTLGKISYASGNGISKKLLEFSKIRNSNSKKTFYISGGNLQSLKIKSFLYFSS